MAAANVVEVTVKATDDTKEAVKSTQKGFDSLKESFSKVSEVATGFLSEQIVAKGAEAAAAGFAAASAALAVLAQNSMATAASALENRLSVINHSIKKQPEHVAAFGLLRV